MFYGGEEYHQDYYQRNLANYLIYKANCGREKIGNNMGTITNIDFCYFYMPAS